MSPSPSSPPHHDDIMFRRREKRRHITQQSIDIRDPFSVIALAIRFDESLAVTENDDGARLQVPLETGSLYNQKAFAKALLNLQKQTTASLRHIPRKQQQRVSSLDPTVQQPASSSSSSYSSSSSSPAAMTPIILSGLVATIQDRSESDDDEDHEDNITGPSAVELVAYCRSMRRAALTRVRLTHRRRKIQRTITPIILLMIVVALIMWTTSKAKIVLYEYGFVGDGSCQSNKACRLAATHIWGEYCDPGHRLVIPNCHVDQCDVMEGQLDYPFYSMHTILKPLFIPLSEINHPRKSTFMVRWPYRRQTSTFKQQSAVQWLGETIVNRLIRETIMDYFPSSTPISMLDAGCGVGGTLYAMLDVQNPPSKPFRYHGIAMSAPEIYQANLFLRGHHLDNPDATRKTNTEMILFEQRDYDEPLPLQSYSVIVAVESLAHSPNLSHTLQVLANALQKGGILLIVEDVLAPWVSNTRAQDLAHAMGKPSLKTYDQWATVTTSLSNLLEKEVWDLALEFDMSYALRDPTVDATVFDTIMDWRYQMTRHLAAEVGKRFGGRKGDDNHSYSQLMQLIKNLSERDLAVRARRQAYRQADLLYYFMIYVKL